MNTTAELRTLNDDEIDDVTGAGKMVCEYQGSNAWQQWIGDNFKIFITDAGTYYPVG